MEGADTTTAPPDPAASAASWRKILTLLGGQGISLTGDYILLIALSWTAVQLGGEREVTTLMLASSIPRALMLIFGGAVADMLGPRFVLLRTTAARTVLQGGGALVVLSLHQFWPLFIVAFVEGALLGLGSPSTGSIMPELVEGDQLDRANSLYATVLRVAPIVGTPVGAWLITVGHVWQAMLVVSVTSLVAFSGLFYVTKGMRRPPPVLGASLVRRSMDGLTLLAGHARLRWIFISALVLDMAFGWPIEVALPLLVKQRGWHVGVIGIVIAAFSAGALATGLIGAFVAHRLSFRFRLVATGVGLAAGILAMALVPSVIGLAVVGALVGLMSGLNGPATVTVYQRSAPKAKMGAAMSMLTLAGIGTVPFSIAVFGGLAALIGLQATWVVCGALAFTAPIAAAIGLRCPVSRDETSGEPRAAGEPAAGEVKTKDARAGEPVTTGAEEIGAVTYAARSTS